MSSERESTSGGNSALKLAIDRLNRLEDQLILLGLPFLEDDVDNVLEDEAFISQIKMNALEMKAYLLPLMSDDLAKIWWRAEEFTLGLMVSEDPRSVLVSSVAVCVICCSLKAHGNVSIKFALENSRAHSTFRPKIEELCNSNELREYLIEKG